MLHVAENNQKSMKKYLSVRSNTADQTILSSSYKNECRNVHRNEEMICWWETNVVAYLKTFRAMSNTTRTTYSTLCTHLASDTGIPFRHQKVKIGRLFPTPVFSQVLLQNKIPSVGVLYGLERGIQECEHLPKEISTGPPVFTFTTDSADLPLIVMPVYTTHLLIVEERQGTSQVEPSFCFCFTVVSFHRITKKLSFHTKVCTLLLF